MTSLQLQQWILHPESLNRESLYELRTLVARYPYFQSLRLLYLKNLFLLHDINFGAELRKAVLYVADRRSLFYLIEGDRYILHREEEQPAVLSEGSGEPGVDRTLFLIDAFLSSMPEDHSQSTGLDYTMDYTAYLLKEENSGSLDENVPQLRGQELIDGFLDKVENAGKVTAQEETAASEVQEYEAMPSESGEERGKTLAVEEPASDVEKRETASAQDEEAAENLPSSSEEWDDSCLTETLAKIYIKQHRYEKALEIIKKLSLNYPKKNAYFADQIRFLEKLIINAKSK